MRPNRLRELLRARKPNRDAHIHSAWPATVELGGHSGVFDSMFDWFTREGETMRKILEAR
jgi:hypothetical protein